MNQTRRFSLLQGAALALLGGRLWSKSSHADKSIKPVLVKAGADHEGKSRTVGVSATSYKVLTAETEGAMFVMEQANVRKGGPSRHYHLNQDELFYVLEGEYVVEVGSERFHLLATVFLARVKSLMHGPLSERPKVDCSSLIHPPEEWKNSSVIVSNWA